MWSDCKHTGEKVLFPFKHWETNSGKYKATSPR